MPNIRNHHLSIPERAKSDGGKIDEDKYIKSFAFHNKILLYYSIKKLRKILSLVVLPELNCILIH